jgi:mono/diheme cytochrome c family protein
MMQRVTLIIMAAGLLLMASCDRTRHEKGYEYFPDMAHSRAFETYGEHPELDNNMAMMLAPEGTVPMGFTPYPFSTGAEGREMMAKVKSPMENNDINIKKGEEQYDIFCKLCHGATGDGSGNLFKSGLYSFQPSSLVNDKMKAATDGEYYHVITNGWGLMGAHGNQISSDDRWKIILFIRNKLQTQS